MQFLLTKTYTSTMLLTFYAIFHHLAFMLFLLTKSYTSTMLLVFHAIFHYLVFILFSVRKSYTSTMLLTFYAILSFNVGALLYPLALVRQNPDLVRQNPDLRSGFCIESFLLRKTYTSTMLLVFHAIFITQCLYNFL